MEEFFSSGLVLLQATDVDGDGINILSLLLATLFTAVVLLGASYILPGVRITNFMNALLLAIVTALIIFGINYLLAMAGINLGWLFSIIVTVIALLVADRVLDGVQIDAWWWALIVAILVGLANLLVPGSGIL